MLGSCLSEQEAAPDWSSVGLLLMFLVLLVLLALLEYLRISGRCRRKAQSQEDDVMQLIEAVGFKVGLGWAPASVAANRAHSDLETPGGAAGSIELLHHQPMLHAVWCQQTATRLLRGALQCCLL